MQRLEHAEFLMVEKAFVDSKPTTILSITNIGMKAISEYADVLRGTLDIINNPNLDKEKD